MTAAGLVVGLTGGIGSGKSSAADLFVRRGVPVVDSDVIAHQLTGAGGGAMKAIGEAFGASVVGADGALDRSAMRRLAFADPELRHRLEEILHPMIRTESDRQCRQAMLAGAAYVLEVVPLLVESPGYRERVDRVLVVDADDDARIARVSARSGLSRDDVLRIMSAQASRQVRLAAADDVIRNDGSLQDLADQVEKLHRKYLGLASPGKDAGPVT
jgi:dephospho-CoA kinase